MHVLLNPAPASDRRPGSATEERGFWPWMTLQVNSNGLDAVPFWCSIAQGPSGGGGLKHEKITKVHGLAKSLVKYWFTIYFVLYRHWFDWKLNFIEFNEQSGNSASDPVQDAIVWRRERRNDFLQKWNPRPSSFISCVCVCWNEWKCRDETLRVVSGGGHLPLRYEQAGKKSWMVFR